MRCQGPPRKRFTESSPPSQPPGWSGGSTRPDRRRFLSAGWAITITTLCVCAAARSETLTASWARHHACSPRMIPALSSSRPKSPSTGCAKPARSRQPTQRSDRLTGTFSCRPSAMDRPQDPPRGSPCRFAHRGHLRNHSRRRGRPQPGERALRDSRQPARGRVSRKLHASQLTNLALIPPVYCW